jgi:hypothetical protein
VKCGRDEKEIREKEGKKKETKGMQVIKRVGD